MADADERWRAPSVTIEDLKRHPHLGRERLDLLPNGIRSWRIKRFPRWLIFYTLRQDGALVLLRVRSGTMNLVVLQMES